MSQEGAALQMLRVGAAEGRRENKQGYHARPPTLSTKAGGQVAIARPGSSEKGLEKKASSPLRDWLLRALQSCSVEPQKSKGRPASP